MSFLDTVVDYFKASRKRRGFLVCALLLIALILRVLLFSVPSYDIIDFYTPWYEMFLRYGRDTALGMTFSIATPPMLYLIDIMTLFPFIPRDAAMRVLGTVFDLFTAWGIYASLKALGKDSVIRWIGTITFLFMPVIIAGSAMWGQADIFYIAFLVWMVYFLVKGNNFWATVCLGVAFSFKLQAMIVAPLFLVLIARRKYPLYLLLVIPVVYFISVVPAWIAGQPLKDLLMVYLAQFGQYTLPSANAANPYFFLNQIPNRDLVNWIGLGVTTLAMLAYLGIRVFKWKDVSTKSMLYDLSVLTLLLPFLLPKMHDRYFLPAAVFLFLLTFIDIHAIWAALLCQLALLFSYVPYFTHWSNEWVYVAAVFNLAAVVWLVMQFKDNVGRSAEPIIQDMNAAHQ